MNVIAVGDIALVGDALDNAETLLKALGELVCGRFKRRTVYSEADRRLLLPSVAGGVHVFHDV